MVSRRSSNSDTDRQSILPGSEMLGQAAIQNFCHDTTPSVYDIDDISKHQLGKHRKEMGTT